MQAGRRPQPDVARTQDQEVANTSPNHATDSNSPAELPKRPLEAKSAGVYCFQISEVGPASGQTSGSLDYARSSRNWDIPTRKAGMHALDASLVRHWQTHRHLPLSSSGPLRHMDIKTTLRFLRPRRRHQVPGGQHRENPRLCPGRERSQRSELGSHGFSRQVSKLIGARTQYIGSAALGLLDRRLIQRPDH